MPSLVGSEMCIRDRVSTQSTWGIKSQTSNRENTHRRAQKTMRFLTILVIAMALISLVASIKTTGAEWDHVHNKPWVTMDGNCLATCRWEARRGKGYCNKGPNRSAQHDCCKARCGTYEPDNAHNIRQKYKFQTRDGTSELTVRQSELNTTTYDRFVVHEHIC
eukprot:TRINITY_DN1553_c0_g1_i4.p1 TRINITY_DN1553_c0_g1~~TRINITY_DN1553_c0_g1_i4.p1  ORF type:complete len:163 (+),score=41.74 TRINITY_DN1553_c0_g1_i4:100-588(+)